MKTPSPGAAILGETLVVALAILLIATVPAQAQDISISMGEGGSLSGRAIQLIALITVLSLAPGLAVMITAFPFIITVLSILRQGIGLQQSPPNMLLVSLALFLTWFVMEPTFTTAWKDGIAPLVAEELPLEDALPRAIAPFRDFMAARLDATTFEAMAAL